MVNKYTPLLCQIDLAIAINVFYAEYVGNDAIAIEKDDVSEETFNNAVDNEYHSLTENTKKTIVTQLKYWIIWVEENKTKANVADNMKTYIAYPQTKVIEYFKWLFEVHKESSINPEGHFTNSQMTINKLLKCQRGIPDRALIDKHPTFIKLLKDSTKLRVELKTSGKNVSDRFGGNTLTFPEIEKVIDSAMRYHEPNVGINVACMLAVGLGSGYRGDSMCHIRLGNLNLIELDHYKPVKAKLVILGMNEGKTNNKAHLHYTGLASHKLPHLDAQGLIAEKIIYDIHKKQSPILDLIAKGDTTWQNYSLLSFNGSNMDKRQTYDSLAIMMIKVLAIAGISKTSVLHLLRSTGSYILSLKGASLDQLNLWGDWGPKGICERSYLSKNPAALSIMYMKLAGWFESDIEKKYFLGRGTIKVPNTWIKALFPFGKDWKGDIFDLHKRVAATNLNGQIKKQGVDSKTKHIIDERNKRRKVDDLQLLQDEDDNAELFLETLIYLGEVFWRNIPFKLERYHKSNCDIGDNEYFFKDLPCVKDILLTKEYELFSRDVVSAHNEYMEKSEMPITTSNPELSQALVGIQTTCNELRTLVAEGAPSTSRANEPEVPKESRIDLNTKGIPMDSIFNTNVKTVQQAWEEWNNGFSNRESIKSILHRREIGDLRGFIFGTANSNALSKNKNLPEFIQDKIAGGLDQVDIITRIERIRTSGPLSLPQLREAFFKFNSMLPSKWDKNKLQLKNGMDTLILGHKSATLHWFFEELIKEGLFDQDTFNLIVDHFSERTRQV
jgi:hypothetical protein